MFLPVLFGQGHIGLILRGAARSGKSTLMRSMGYLRLGRPPKTPSGIHKRDLIAVLQRKQIVFFDEIKTITPELDEALRRMITHDGDEIRALYSDLGTVETELQGSVIFCATNLSHLTSDLRTRCFVWDLEEKGDSQFEDEILILPKGYGGRPWRGR
jgi:predicted P-loop ATPase